jgi:regulation of enolase protein 1 (concanavalin A-like superfamily)
MPADLSKVKELFLAVLDLPAGERAGYLEAACSGDSMLRQRIEAMLRSHEASGELLPRSPAEMLADSGATEADATAAWSRQAASEATVAGPPVAAPDGLPFLTPSGKPGTLGRLGYYEVQEIIGKGGFGIVLRAFDEKLHRVVAIKVLSPAYATIGSARERFIREARAAAAVKNEHVVAIYNVQDEEQPPYLVMELIDGVTLQEKLDNKGPLSVKEILRIGLQTAEGLAAAHKQGLVHRDIKPSNILLENGVERVKITDFGLARAVDDASVSQSGTVAGTPMFMSPEQAEGLSVDHRSDLFSLGSVLYAMCTGHPPFRASGTHAVLKRVIDASPRPVREINNEIPDWLADIIAKLHARKPEDRFQRAKEVAELLEQHLAHLQQPAVAPRPAPVAVPRAASAGSLEKILEGRDSTKRVLQHTGLLVVVLLAIGPVVVGALNPARITLAPPPLLFAFVLLFVVARIKQRWSVEYRGHRIRFENSCITGEYLYLDDILVARGGVGFRNELRAIIPGGEGAGDEVVVLADAGLFGFHCRIYVEHGPEKSSPISARLAGLARAQRLLLALGAALCVAILVCVAMIGLCRWLPACPFVVFLPAACIAGGVGVFLGTGGLVARSGTALRRGLLLSALFSLVSALALWVLGQLMGAPGNLLILCDDPNVRVRLKGFWIDQEVGPGRYAVPPEMIEVTVEKDGKVTFRQNISINPSSGTGVTIPSVATGHLAHGQTVEGWGKIVDPLGDCRFVSGLEMLNIIVPAGHHNLNPDAPFKNVAAPRVLSKARGDFDVRVKVPPFSRPKPKTSTNGQNSYVGAGLLLWSDANNFVRFLRAANGDSGRLFVSVEVFRQGTVISWKDAVVPDEAILLRMERRGGTLRCTHSADGVAWLEVPFDRPVPWTGEVEVGVAAVNSTTTMHTAYFQQFELKERQAEQQKALQASLQQVAIAMHNYHDTNGKFPTPASYDKEGTPLLSWRVHLLPFLGEEDLYRQFKLDQPWDGPDNRGLIAKIPAVYGLGAADGKTSLVVPVGKDTIFPGGKGIKQEEIQKGLNNTVLILEADDAHRVTWTKPDDWPFNPYQPSQGLGPSFLAVRADGAVFDVSSKLPAPQLRAIFTRRGEEPAPQEVWKRPGFPGPEVKGPQPAEPGWVERFPGYVQGLAVSPGGNVVAVGVKPPQGQQNPDFDVRLLDRATGEELHRLKGPARGVGAQTLSFSPDGKRVAGNGGGSDHKAYVWSTETGELLHTLVGHTDNVSAVTFSPGGELLLTMSWDRTLRLWDGKNGKRLPVADADGAMRVPACDWSRAVFLPGSLRAIVGGLDKLALVEFEHVKTGPKETDPEWTVRLVREFIWPGGRVTAMSLSRDGRRLLTYGSDGSDGRVRLWDVATGGLLRTFDTPTAPKFWWFDVAFLPDGKRFLTTGIPSGQGSPIALTLRDADTGKVLETFQGHTDAIIAIAATPDGQYAVSGGLDQTVRLWQLPGP